MNPVKSVQLWGVLVCLLLCPTLIGAARVCVKRHCFESEVAKTAEEQEMGLMFRSHLPANRAMLFVFPSARRQAFWMKNTYLSLDLLFIGSDKRVAHIHHSAIPRTLDVISPSVLVPYVLEINGGLSKKYRFKVGDMVTIQE